MADRVPGDREIHLWWTRLSLRHEEYADVARMLSLDERRRSDAYRVEAVRRRFVIGRGILRVLLGSYLGIDGDAVHFTYSPSGKPLLAARHASDLTFSVSHSHDTAVYAVARVAAIGVDVERLRPVGHRAIVERYFSPAERAAYRALPESQQQLAFFLGWTRKEALLKAGGADLTETLASVEVTLVPGAPPCIASAPQPDSSWWLEDLPAPPGFVGALAGAGPRVLVRTATVTPAELARRIHGPQPLLYA